MQERKMEDGKMSGESLSYLGIVGPNGWVPGSDIAEWGGHLHARPVKTLPQIAD
jgi:hypothetical protein